MGRRAISYGGGVQSTALVVLAATGRIEADVALFSNVGDDSEHPATLDYVRNVATPWAAERGLRIEELQPTRHGKPTTLWQQMYRDDVRRTMIPVYGESRPLARSCTADFKVAVVGRRLRELGATPASPADVLIGISVDEIERAGRGKDKGNQRRLYPLLDLGLTRSGCEQVIRDAGLPIPPKSSCFFCPFHRPQTWRELRRDEPELFTRAAELEEHLNARSMAAGLGPMRLTRFGRPLDEAIDEAQAQLFTGDGSSIGEDGCDEGMCFV